MATSSTNECAICLETLEKPGVARFIAECGHSFHFRFEADAALVYFSNVEFSLQMHQVQRTSRQYNVPSLSRCLANAPVFKTKR